MKRITRTFAAFLTVSSLIVTPVYAKPNTVDVIQKQKKEAQREVTSLQADFTKILTKMDDIETDMITKGEEIIQATSDLEQAQKEEKKQYEDMKERIRILYENGDTALLTRIFESGSIAEMLKQAENVQALHTYDRKKLEEFVETKENVEKLKETLESDMRKMKTLKADLSKQKEKLAKTIEDKKEEVADLEQQLQKAAEEAARKAAEEQRRKEARAAMNKPSAPSIPNTPNKPNVPEKPSTPDKPSTPSKPNPPSEPGGGNGSGSEDNGNAGSGNVSVGQAIVAAARSYIGVPYVWGGMSPSGVDCSGLTSLAHQAVGIHIPRNSAGQAGKGKNVGGLANALPGDIICYPGHVAIYIGGNRVIHAPTEGQTVREASVFMGPSQPITAIRRYW